MILSSTARVPLRCFYHCDLLPNRRMAIWNLFEKGITKRDYKKFATVHTLSSFMPDVMVSNRHSKQEQPCSNLMFNSVNIMEIVPFSKIILTKEIITRLLCCLNRKDSNGYRSKLLFYNLRLFFYGSISSLTFNSCNSF